MHRGHMNGYHLGAKVFYVFVFRPRFPLGVYLPSINNAGGLSMSSRRSTTKKKKKKKKPDLFDRLNISIQHFDGRYVNSAFRERYASQVVWKNNLIWLTVVDFFQTFSSLFSSKNTKIFELVFSIESGKWKKWKLVSLFPISHILFSWRVNDQTAAYILDLINSSVTAPDVWSLIKIDGKMVDHDHHRTHRHLDVITSPHSRWLRKRCKLETSQGSEISSTPFF